MEFAEFQELAKAYGIDVPHLKCLIRLTDACKILVISYQQGHRLINRGHLQTVPATPFRVTAASVLALLTPSNQPMEKPPVKVADPIPKKRRGNSPTRFNYL